MEYLADTNILLRSIDHYPEWRRLVVTHSVSGVRVHDTHLVAAMNVYGITRLPTFNGPDFTRYPGIHVVHPNDAAKTANP